MGRGARWGRDGTRRGAAIAALGGLVAAGGLGASGRRAPQPEREPPACYRLVERAAEAGIDVRNVSGDPAKPYIVESTGSGACFFDYDGDGLLDLYVVNGARFDEPARWPSPHDRLYRNRGDGGFEDVTRRAGIVDGGWGGGCAAGDIDNDGDADLYVTNFGPNALWINRGDGTFVEATERAGVSAPGVSSSAAFGDLDGDGFVDLYVGTYLDFDRETTPRIGDGRCFYGGVEVYCGPDGLAGAADRLFRNRGDGRFSDETAAAGVESPDAKTLGVVLSDLDGDGRTDIYAACDSTMNLFFRNRGGLRFDDEALVSGAGFSGRGYEQSGMGVAAGDPDGDGDFDLFVTNFQNDANTFYRNLGGGLFEDATDRLGLARPSLHYLGWGTHFADLDNDGDEDLFVANGHVYPQAERRGEPYAQRNQLFVNRGGDGWTEAAVAGGGLDVVESSRGTAVGDYDDDGWLEIFVNNIDAEPSLFDGAGCPERHSLAILLVGVGANRDGLGARIELDAGGTTQSRERRGSDGYLGSNDPRLHFGLGGAGRADEVRIRWPAGAEEVLGPLEAGFVYVVKEGRGVVGRRAFRASRRAE